VVGLGVGIAVGVGGAIVATDQINKGWERVEGGLQQTVDHTSEKLTSDAEENAENLVEYLINGKKNPIVSSVESDDLMTTEKSEQLSPIKKVSDILKDTIESTGHQVAVDFSQHIEQSGHKLTVDLAQNVGRMMLSYTLGLFGAFFAYKQIVDYFTYQEKIDYLDIAAQEQAMPLLPRGNLLQFLQKRKAALIAAEREQLQYQQNRKFYLAGCGSLTFAAACGLCSYWIQ
jgi:hypothetical protein